VSGLYPLLEKNATPETLQNIWQTNYTYEEERLSDLLGLFGYGCSILADSKASNLHFQRLSDSERGFRIVREGKPILACSVADLFVNGRFGAVSINNTGGPSKGLSLVIDGDLAELLKQDPAQYDYVEMNWFVDPSPLDTFDTQPERVECLAKLYPHVFADGNTRLIADFPDVPSPNGLVIDAAKRYSTVPPWECYQLFTCLVARFKFSVKTQENLSESPFSVQVSPHENWELGSAICHGDFCVNAEEYDEKCRKEIEALDREYGFI
jgi:hypothetical protein